MGSATAGDALARRIRERAHLVGEFRLRSGAVSGEFFDKPGGADNLSAHGLQLRPVVTMGDLQRAARRLD